MADTIAMSDIRDSSSVDKYNGTNFHLRKMQLSFLFQSCEFFSIVNGTLKKSTLSTIADEMMWEEKDKQAIVAIWPPLIGFTRQRLSTAPLLMKCGRNFKPIMTNTPTSASSRFKKNTTGASLVLMSLLPFPSVLMNSMQVTHVSVCGEKQILFLVLNLHLTEYVYSYA